MVKAVGCTEGGCVDVLLYVGTWERSMFLGRCHTHAHRHI
jgi:hypothetical protein